MQVIALLSTKGGAGKTALATALAVEMGREGKHLDAGAPGGYRVSTGSRRYEADRVCCGVDVPRRFEAPGSPRQALLVG